MHPYGAQHDRAASAPANEFHDRVRNVVQIGHVREFRLAASDATETRQWPIRIGAIPDLAAARQSRPLDERLASSPFHAGTTCLILHGMGGAGKTQAAAAYAHDRWRSGDIELLVWVNAASRDAVIATYAQAAVEICDANPDDIESSAARFLSWLDRPTGRRWLLVLDDLTDPAHLNGLWPPSNPDGRALVTTRRRDAALDGAGRTRLAADLFTESEGLAFLRRRLGDASQCMYGARRLVADLGFLPLALAQAAAYILDQPGMTCEDYRRLLADRSIALAQLRPESLPDGHVRATAAAWSLSIERVDAVQPVGAASALLQLMSLLDPNGIPVALLTGGTAAALLKTVTGSSASGVGDPGDDRALHRVLGRLRQMSLVEHDGRLMRMHALVQRAVFDEISDVDSVATTAAAALVEGWPEPERHSPLSAVFRSNVAYLWRAAGPSLLRGGVHELLFRSGESLGNHGRTAEALAYFERLHAAARAECGADHPEALRVRSRIAHWRQATGDVVGAFAALEALAAECIEVLGPAHPLTFAVRVDLAKRQGECGDDAGAARALEGIIEEQERALGPDHPGLLEARFSLARWRGRAGDATYVVDVLGALLEEHVLRLGPNDPATLAVRSSIARWQGRTGDIAGAVAAYERLRADRAAVFGARHPDTLNARYHLATWTGRSGRRSEAIAMLEALIPELIDIHGASHPRALRAWASLACWCGESGDAARARDTLADLLPEQSSVLGSDHPHTFETRHNLGRFQGEAGDPDAAVSTLKGLLADRSRVLGPDHPKAAATRADLEFWAARAAMR
jgi:hypothetical protein